MALKHGSSAKLGCQDILDTVKAFERHNSVEIVLAGARIDRSGRLDLVWTATAYEGDPTAPEAKPLASVSVGCLESRLETMDAVIFQLLYALDFQLAQNAFIDAMKPKA